MAKHKVAVECPVPGGFAVDQVRGMFDLSPAKVARETFCVELPDADEEWQIGVIVGPSGSGKTTVAREAYGSDFAEGGFEWDPKQAVIAQFGELSIKDVTQTLTSVGLSSPPAWLKPYQVLSGGERFRCDLARALLRPGDLVAFDEFTSVVDRNVAKIGSAAVAKSIRKGRLAKRFVAVTCHYDILEWLEPDWVLDMATQQLARGCLYQRPTIELEVAPVHRGAWELFRRHHYLSGELHLAARCFAAFWGDEPVAFSAWMHRMTQSRQRLDRREHRTVVLPDYQGVGIGNRVSELCASIYTGAGGRAFSTTSHPGMIHYRHASPRWKTVRFGMAAPNSRRGLFGQALRGTGRRAADSCGRVTGGFEYVGPPMDRAEAEAMLAAKPRIFGDDQCARILAALPAGGGFSSARSVAARAGLSLREAEHSLSRLAKSGEVQAERVGKRVGCRSAV